MSKTELKLWNRDDNLFKAKEYAKRSNDYKEIDLNHISIVHSGIDTFKQLFRGEINQGIYEAIEAHHETTRFDPIYFGSNYFAVTRSSMASGYKYILRNNTLGLVVLLKSQYSELDEEGTHLKMECSPHFIMSRTPKEIDDTLSGIAALFLSMYSPVSPSVHLCADIAGFDIPDDFEKRLKTKARRSFTFSGISEWEAPTVDSIAVKYGKNESHTFGSVSSLQFCIYDKMKEVNVTDKKDYWMNVWSDMGINPIKKDTNDEPLITRIEARFHHTVINQFSKGTNGMDAFNFQTLVPHLTNLWKYFLNQFRLHHSAAYIDPLWQLLGEDVSFGQHQKLVYIRDYKGSSASSARNVAFWFGNYLKLCCRQSLVPEFVAKNIMQTGLIPCIKDYLKVNPRLTTSELCAYLEHYIKEKYIGYEIQGVAV